VGYLSPVRSADNASGGEAQPPPGIANCGQGFTGLCMLDGFVTGLHQRDNERLLITLGTVVT
jgi:excinuclease UvrABC ATPase subunit